MIKRSRNVIMLLTLELFILLVIYVNATSDYTEVTFPVGSSIQLECDDSLGVINNIDVIIQRSNTTCLAPTEKCTLPNDAIGTIKEKCNREISCKVDLRDIINNHWCLQDHGYVNVWYACKALHDFSCDFETNLCDWVPMQTNHQFRWKRGRRPSGRAPIIDHTTTSTTGSYAYIESNYSETKEGDIAKLESGNIMSTPQQCLSFWYFKTSYIDSLNILQNNDNLFKIPEAEYGKWHNIQIPLEMTTHKSYNLGFEVIHGNDGSYGVVVIDDIVVENHKCNSSILKCDFEYAEIDSECDWNSYDSNKNVWKKENGTSTLYFNGPSYDHSTASGSGYYMFLKSHDHEETTTYLEFQNFDLRHVSGNVCLTFWYRMLVHAGYRKEGLNVTIADKLFWTQFGNQEHKWNKGTIDLNNIIISSIKFIGILGSKGSNLAIDDISLTKGTCDGLFFHEDTCVHLKDNMPKDMFCPKGYLDLQIPRFSFDPKRNECSIIYDQAKTRILEDCKNGVDLQKCMIDLSTEINVHPECFQLYEFRILHKCEVIDYVVTIPTVMQNSNESTTVNDKGITVPTVMETSNESVTGLVVGLVIGGLLLASILIVIVVLLRRRTCVSGPKEQIRNDLQENDYIGSQDIALPQTDNSVSHLQNESSRNTVHGYTNTGRVETTAYAMREITTLSDNQSLNDNKCSIVDQTAETSFNGTIHNRPGTADTYMVLDPTETGFNRTQLAKPSTGYEFAKPMKDSENKEDDEDQYALSEEGVYDHSGNIRHKELEDNIYNHAVDNIYDSGSHKRNDDGRGDTYDHFFGQKTEDDYDITTTT